MISRHWKIQNGIEKKARIKNAPKFAIKQSLVTLDIKNSNLIPEWAENKTKLLVKGYSEDKKNSDCMIETKDDSFAFLRIERGNIVINNFNNIVNNLIYEQYYKIRRPLYSRLPFDYTKIPVGLRNSIFNLFMNLKTDPGYPNWPIEKSVELIRHLYIKSISIKLRKPVPYISLWPKEKRFAILITHDCDTESSFINANKIREIEKRYKVKSSWNILSNKYRINLTLLKKLKEEGCEIGLHGYNHDNKMPFLRKTKIIRRIESASDLIKKLAIRGFRSPSLLRNKDFLELLSLYFAYDSSTSDTDICSPLGMRNGTCTVFPFFIKNMVEIPITMPQDYRLIRLKKTKYEIFEIWKRKIDFLRKVNGLIVLLTHPDSHIFGNDEYFSVYEKTLKYLTSFNDGWLTIPSEVEKWWNERDTAWLKNGRAINSKRATVSYII